MRCVRIQTDIILRYVLFYNPTEKKYACKDVVEGIEYEFRVAAINISGAGEPSAPSEFVFARDPKSEYHPMIRTLHNTTQHCIICMVSNNIVFVLMYLSFIYTIRATWKSY